MVFDEHGMMHMNSTAGVAYGDNIKQKNRWIVAGNYGSRLVRWKNR
jgi:uncharacterized protein involved in high-affinity Fe2+ transport